MSAACPVCGSRRALPVHRVDDAPAHDAVIYPDRARARACPRGTIDLRVCDGCALVRNAAFAPSRVEYTTRYEGSQRHSPTFGRFAASLGRRLAGPGRGARLAGATVVEIGCGDASFLADLCARTGARGVGVDPALDPAAPAPPGLSLLARRFEDAAALVPPADLVLCRHLLEHLADPVALLRRAAGILAGPDSRIVIEVPDAGRIFALGAFWDVYYEHCAYFTAGTLHRAVEAAGLAVRRLWRGFAGQYLIAEAARPGRAPAGPPSPLAEPPAASRALAEGFSRLAARARDARARALGRAAARGERVALWGGASKAVGLLAALGEAPAVRAAVDIHPRRQGRYLPGSGLGIVAPAALPRLRPDRVMIMNGIYLAEVRAELERRGLEPRLEPLP